MAKLASNNNKAEGPFTQPVTSPSLVYYVNGKKYYYPLIKPDGSFRFSSFIFSYDRSAGDTFGIALNNTKYVVPNKRQPIAAVYDIPAGTYSPSKFKSLIDSYISPNNGSRRVSNSFKATVNGQTITVNANTTIYNENNESSGSSVLSYGVNFSGEYLVPGNCFGVGIAYNFIDNKVYVTQSRGIPYFGNYRNYNITISTGIKFK